MRRKLELPLGRVGRLAVAGGLTHRELAVQPRREPAILVGAHGVPPHEGDRCTVLVLRPVHALDGVVGQPIRRDRPRGAPTRDDGAPTVAGLDTAHVRGRASDLQLETAVVHDSHREGSAASEHQHPHP